MMKVPICYIPINFSWPYFLDICLLYVCTENMNEYWKVMLRDRISVGPPSFHFNEYVDKLEVSASDICRKYFIAVALVGYKWVTSFSK